MRQLDRLKLLNRLRKTEAACGFGVATSCMYIFRACGRTCMTFLVSLGVYFTEIGVLGQSTKRHRH